MGPNEALVLFLDSEGQTAEEFLWQVIGAGGDLAVAMDQKIRQSIADKDQKRLERIVAFVEFMPYARTANVLRVEEDLREGRIDFG